jgi:uncharacterized protein
VVIFWDTSALLPLLVKEPESERASALAKANQHVVVWWGTAIECASAIARREREGAFTSEASALARQVLRALQAHWSEILPTEDVRDHARRLLLRHPLRAADAFQLGAAMAWASAKPRKHVFATFDARLADAARKEGFNLALRSPAG